MSVASALINMINSTTAYLAAICVKNQRAEISWPDAIPATHTGPSDKMSRELTQPRPALWSKTELAARGRPRAIEQQRHKPSDDTRHVFCYLAPRVKPDDGSPRVLFLFAERRRESRETAVVAQYARPFDSGGLRRDPCFGAWTNAELEDLIRRLTFGGSWRGDFEVWAAHMFSSIDACMLGEAPIGIEPFGLNTSDRWNFTWELLSEGTLPFAGRLVAIMEIRWPGNPSSLTVEALKAITRKNLDKRIRFQISESKASGLDRELYALFQSACALPGW